jgi:hypothetical protein
LNLYFLWSVERVGVLCSLQTIGGKDWYRWGAQLLVPAQRKDGSWLGRGNGGMPVIDTSMALLFLKRSDLLPDLRETLKKRLTITDPGLDPKAVSPGKSPGEKADPKGAGQKQKGPAEKADPAAKDRPEEGTLAADLGEVKAGQKTVRPLRVRGPAAFRITGVRGGDAQLQAEAGSQSREVHELTLTLHPEQAGEFVRTLYLHTDLPGRAEVAVRLRARAAP